MCTTTLAAGVNLPAARVIIREVTRYNLDTKQQVMWLGTSMYQQIAGRAGRTGVTSAECGECMLVVSKSDKLNSRADRADRRVNESEEGQVIRKSLNSVEGIILNMQEILPTPTANPPTPNLQTANHPPTTS